MGRWEDKVIVGITLLSILLLLVFTPPTIIKIGKAILGNSNSLKSNIEEDNKDDYEAPDSSLPKDIKLVYKMLDKSNKSKSGIKLTLDEGYILAEVKNKDDLYKYIVEYSNKYDCTTIKYNKEDKEPMGIVYHFEYDNKDDYSMEVFSLLKSNNTQSTYNVKIEKNEDGSIKLNVE